MPTYAMTLDGVKVEEREARTPAKAVQAFCAAHALVLLDETPARHVNVRAVGGATQKLSALTVNTGRRYYGRGPLDFETGRRG